MDYLSRSHSDCTCQSRALDALHFPGNDIVAQLGSPICCSWGEQVFLGVNELEPCLLQYHLPAGFDKQRARSFLAHEFPKNVFRTQAINIPVFSLHLRAILSAQCTDQQKSARLQPLISLVCHGGNLLPRELENGQTRYRTIVTHARRIVQHVGYLEGPARHGFATQ